MPKSDLCAQKKKPGALIPPTLCPHEHPENS